MRRLMSNIRSTVFILPALLCAAIVSTALVVPAAAQTPNGDAKNIFEIRVYSITAGKMDAFVKWMATVTKWQESVGMQIMGQFAAPAQNRYVWIRQYPDEATRQKRFATVYDSGGMKQFGMPPGYEGGDVYLATAKSSKLEFGSGPKRMLAPSADPRIYEFRIYDIKPGTADSLATYMRDTMIPWQERTYKVNVFAQLVPYASVTGTSGGGKVMPEQRTYIWGRVFTNENERTEKYKMYQDPEFRRVWNGSPGQAAFEKARIIILATPTSISKLQ